jgi:glutathione S-transferase
MSLTLYYHPLASFCWKALIALYENDTPFEPVLVDLGDERSRADFAAVWPMAKFPVLHDGVGERTVAEATIIIEYLDAFYRGKTRFLPREQDEAWRTRMWDRVFDDYVHESMQKVVTDRIRPEGRNDLYGVEEAKARIREAYALIDREIGSRKWMMGDDFSLADCAAAPALFYANIVAPFGASLKNLPRYLERLEARPSFARVLQEAEPYFQMFPMEQKPEIRQAAANYAPRTAPPRA